MDGNQLCGLYYGYGRQMGTYTADGIIAISEMLKVNSTLQSIRCAFCARFLAKRQQPVTNLCLTLVRSMHDNNMGAEGAKHFADALVVNQSITSLKCAHTPNAIAFL